MVVQLMTFHFKITNNLVKNIKNLRYGNVPEVYQLLLQLFDDIFHLLGITEPYEAEQGDSYHPS